VATTNADAGTAAADFERHRAHLTAVAYSMLGTLTDAEDAVQETYLRFAAANHADLRNVQFWLTRVVARICLDQLGSARARREQYIGTWLPEPVVRADLDALVSPAGPSPEDQVSLDESVSMAMLVVLEALSPAQRTTFVLREVLGLSYREVAAIVGRGELACRQLVARARVHVRRRAPRFTADQSQHLRAIEAFSRACTRGSIEELIAVLDPKVVLRSDGGGAVRGVARRPVSGSSNVARLLLGIATRHTVATRVSSVNGSPGLVFETPSSVVGVMGFSVFGTLITEIDFVINPAKLGRVCPLEMREGR
jgi:RNA polymerase sigma-70 factor, ECF subfamily